MQKHVKGFSPLYVGGEDWYTALELRLRLRRLDRDVLARQVDRHARLAEVDRRPDAVQGFFHATQSQSTATLDGTSPFPVHRLLAGPDGPRTTARLVHVLHRQGSTRTDEAVRDAEPLSKGKAESRASSAFDPRGPGAEQLDVAGRRLDRRRSPSTRARKALEEKGKHPDAPTCWQQRQRAGLRSGSWFVPQANTGSDVSRNGNILKTMLAQIITGTLVPVKQPRKRAEQNIAQTLNES
jgi:hypothetical protein